MTDLDLTGRRALVTGGAQGLGEGMAQGLAAAGAQVVIGDVAVAGRAARAHRPERVLDAERRAAGWTRPS
jgi:3alpha(or 20beta)-hydroxysteroid dehydrogenase